MPQDVVGRCDVEKELRTRERQQQRPPAEFPFRPAPEREYDLLVRGTVDFSARQTLE